MCGQGREDHGLIFGNRSSCSICENKVSIQFQDFRDLSCRVEKLHLGLQTLADLHRSNDGLNQAMNSQRLGENSFTLQCKSPLHRERSNLKDERRGRMFIRTQPEIQRKFKSIS